MVSPLDETLERIGPRGVRQGLEFVERPLCFFGIGLAEYRADEDGALALGTRCVGLA